MFKRLTFPFFTALLMLSAGWIFGARTELVAEGKAQAPAQAGAPPADFDQAILNAFRWRSIGPLRGGRSIAVSGVKGRPREAYFGAVGGGLWKTTDGGMTWAAVTDGQIKSASVGAVAVSESNPDIVYIGMGESCIRGNIMPGSGVYKSTDGGETWREITRNQGLPQGLVGKISIGISGADSSRIYALIENENGGLYSSDDAGTTWKLVNAGRNIRQRAFYYTHVSADPNQKDTVYMLNTSAFRSTDGGKTLTSIGNGTHGHHHDLWVDPDDSEHVMDGNDGGGAITYNVSSPQRAWTRQDFPTAQMYHVITTKHAPYHVCGAQQDNSTLCVGSNTTFGRGGGGGGRGAVVDPYQAGGGEPGYIAPDPKDRKSTRLNSSHRT